MGPYVIRAPQQRTLNDELFDTVLHKVTTVSSLRSPVVVHLAGANLHFQHLQRLTNHFEQTHTRVFALDMSMNRIQTDWASLNEVVNRLLGPNLVGYLDLGMKLFASYQHFGGDFRCQTELCEVGTEAKLGFGL